MSESRLLYFALGVTSVVSLGAVTNQLAAPAGDQGVTLSDSAIIFPDGTMQSTAATPRRTFYLTESAHRGNEPITACAPGFHFASLYEIRDVSTLRYATDAEGNNDVFRREDSGAGPPSDSDGWIRSGLDSEAFFNCFLWGIADNNFLGVTASLDTAWGADGLVASPWAQSFVGCNTPRQTWCVAD